MNPFRTEINPLPSEFRIDHKTKILMTGSCFSVNIGSYLADTLFPVVVNPFGVIYNPVAVLNTLGILMDGTAFGQEDLEFRNELWFSWDHHTSFSHPERQECLKNINTGIDSSSRHLKECRYLLITFGTAWVYRLKSTGKPVTNCHKFPDSEFVRIFLEPGEIISLWEPFLEELFAFVPELRIIFTVSPVRHWKDGAHGNQISKSSLLLAIDELVKKFPLRTEYFPAYEILLDDLRDYRFFADDMLHPNSMAIDYIQEKFNSAYFNAETVELNKEILKIVRAANHRALHRNTDAYRKFRSSQLQAVGSLSARYPSVDFTPLKNRFE
jgi:hypothetical protein